MCVFIHIILVDKWNELIDMSEMEQNILEYPIKAAKVNICETVEFSKSSRAIELLL